MVTPNFAALIGSATLQKVASNLAAEVRAFETALRSGSSLIRRADAHVRQRH